jgi:hypothetical protein
MSSSPETPRPTGLFIERLVRFLLPYFLTVTQDTDLARAEILETLASYGARTRSEMLDAAKVIAFSFAALETLADAQAPEQEMSPSLRLRFRSCANSLSRYSQVSEKTLEKRLSCDRPNPPRHLAEPIGDISDEEVDAMVQQAQAAIAACRERLPDPRPAGPATASSAELAQLRNSPVMQALLNGANPSRAAARF